MTGETYKNVIESGESDTVEYTFRVPEWAQSPLTIEAVLRYRKLNKKYSNWVFGDQEVNIPFVEMARDTLTIPVLERQSASASQGLRE